jgi:hypothetical protein
MVPYLPALILTLLMPVCQAQEANTGKPTDQSELAAALSFEAQPVGVTPGGWGGGPPGTIFADHRVFHGGRRSARIERNPDSPGDFSTMGGHTPAAEIERIAKP